MKQLSLLCTVNWHKLLVIVGNIPCPRWEEFYKIGHAKRKYGQTYIEKNLTKQKHSTFIHNVL